MFESWLDRKLKVYFSPLVEVVATQEIPNAKRIASNRHINNFLTKLTKGPKNKATKVMKRMNKEVSSVGCVIKVTG